MDTCVYKQRFQKTNETTFLERVGVIRHRKPRGTSWRWPEEDIVGVRTVRFGISRLSRKSKGVWKYNVIYYAAGFGTKAKPVALRPLRSAMERVKEVRWGSCVEQFNWGPVEIRPEIDALSAQRLKSVTSLVPPQGWLYSMIVRAA